MYVWKIDQAVWCRILQFLGLKQWILASKVSKLLYRAHCENILWQTMYKRRFASTAKQPPPTNRGASDLEALMATLQISHRDLINNSVVTNNRNRNRHRNTNTNRNRNRNNSNSTDNHNNSNNSNNSSTTAKYYWKFKYMHTLKQQRLRKIQAFVRKEMKQSRVLHKLPNTQKIINAVKPIFSTSINNSDATADAIAKQRKHGCCFADLKTQTTVTTEHDRHSPKMRSKIRRFPMSTVLKIIPKVAPIEDIHAGHNNNNRNRNSNSNSSRYRNYSRIKKNNTPHHKKKNNEHENKRLTLEQIYSIDVVVNSNRFWNPIHIPFPMPSISEFITLQSEMSLLNNQNHENEQPSSTNQPMRRRKPKKNIRSPIVLLEPRHGLCIAVYHNESCQHSNDANTKTKTKTTTTKADLMRMQKMEVAFILVTITHDLLLSEILPQLRICDNTGVFPPILSSWSPTATRDLFFGYKLDICFRNMGKSFYTQQFRELIAKESNSNQANNNRNSNKKQGQQPMITVSLIGSRESGSGLPEFMQSLPAFIWKTEFFKGNELGIFVMDAVLWNAENKIVFSDSMMVECHPIDDMYNFDDQCENNDRYQFSAVVDQSGVGGDNNSNTNKAADNDDSRFKLSGSIVLLPDRSECSLESLSMDII